MILSFQDEMRQIEETRITSAQKNLKKLEPEKYRPCIETLCECAKEDLELLRGSVSSSIRRKRKFTAMIGKETRNFCPR